MKRQPTVGEVARRVLEEIPSRAGKRNMKWALNRFAMVYSIDSPVDEIESLAEIQEHPDTQRLAPQTQHLLVVLLKQIFKRAVEEGYREKVPRTRKLPPPIPDFSAKVYIPAERVMSLCEKAGYPYSLAFALARFGGLRCPSEVVAMKWDYVGEKVMRVPCLKTRRFGHAFRRVPLFEPLRTMLHTAPREDAYIIPARVSTSWCSTQGVKAQRLAEIALRYGVCCRAPLRNMRASCQTDLMERFPAVLVCRWIGNSIAVAEQYYMRDPPYLGSYADKFAFSLERSDVHELRPEPPTPATNTDASDAATDGFDASAGHWGGSSTDADSWDDTAWPGCSGVV